MKKIKYLFLFGALTLLSVPVSFGQASANKEAPILPIDNSTHKVSYSEVVLVEDSAANKQNLFSRAREWFAKAYKSSTNVVQMEDKESGKIVGKAVMKAYSYAGSEIFSDYGYFHYTISIYVKDGRYKYEITDIYHAGDGQLIRVGTTYVDKVSDWGTCEDMLSVSKKRLQKQFYKNLTEMDSEMKSLIANLKTAMWQTEQSEW